MSTTPFQSDTNVDQLLPDEAPAPLAADELDDLTDNAGLLDAQALTVEQYPQRAYGGSWAFDFVQGQFSPGPVGGPLETRGLATLRGWCEKALRTEGRGSYPIYSADYGFLSVDDVIGMQQNDAALSDLGDRVWAALTFHPRVTDVVGFKTFIDPNDETVVMAFQVITDTNEQIQFTDFRIF